MRKVNKGLILTIIVVIGLIIYLVNLEKQRNEEKTEIKSICEKFIEITDKYSVFPKEKQVINPNVNEEEYNQYITSMNKELKNVMTPNEEAVLIQYQAIEENLKNGYNELEARTNQRRTINKIIEYEFDGKQVTVRFENKVEQITKYFNGIEEQSEKKTFDALFDEIILQKIKGDWKVIYANLQFDEHDRYFDYMMF